MVEPALHPLRRSFFRDSTVLGAERTPALLVMLFAAALVFGGLQWWSTLFGLGFAVVGIWVLRRVYQVHPRMVQVYLEWVRLRSYYPARRCFPPPRNHRLVTLERRR